ncbi:MAG TPA: DUF1385 domain-containing protein [Fimbriimonas sp.]|nr:DUF1385 domain-containing protein [Fimbriimonas sp.]
MADLVPRIKSDFRPATLGSPVRALMRPTLKIEPEDSLALAASRLRQNGSPVLPVVSGNRLIGILSEAVLAKALGNGVEHTDAVQNWLIPAETILAYETGAEALRRLEDGSTLVVVDDQEQLLGLVSANDLWPRRRPPVKPAAVGGMATPLGVYLTTGTTSGGAPKWALILTGAYMALMLVVGAKLASYCGDRLALAGTKADFVATFEFIATLVFFGVIMRLSPLAGTHAAEHQVVHAIEREEDLVPEVVRRMPRVHPRCGTNYAAGALIFLQLFSWEWYSDEGTRLVVAGIATLALWRWVGSLLQFYVTTKPPSERQLANGIKAGQQLLENYSHARVSYPNIWMRLWNAGLFHVALGSSLLLGLVGLIDQYFHLGLLPQVS